MPCRRLPTDDAARRARRRLMDKVTNARLPLGRVTDEPGGGFRVHAAGKSRSLVVGGLGAALAERVFAQGVEHVSDAGPSTARLGNLVHRHVFHVVECIWAGEDCRCGTRFRRPQLANKGALEVLRAIWMLGLAPVACELALVAVAWDLATRADLVCVDTEGGIVLVSIKTGAGRTTRTERRFRSGLAHMYDTQRARHQVQLAAERLMLEKAGVRVRRGFIVYCGPDGKGPGSVPHDAKLWGEDGAAALDALMLQVKR